MSHDETASADVGQHNLEIQENLRSWNRKPLLREIYRSMHKQIAAELAPGVEGLVVELGSGIGNIKEVIPECLRTDLFQNPWLDRTENAYALSFADGSISNLILFDVFHHLRYPGEAFREFGRALAPGGRVLIYEPCMSLLGRIVYGAFHHEPIAMGDPIAWNAPDGWSAEQADYYAAQGNASRIFLDMRADQRIENLQLLSVKRFALLSYVLSGGYSGRQLYPDAAYAAMRTLDRICDRIPAVFATRMLVTLQKS